MNIRYMTLDDVDAIVSLENKVWTAETTPAPLPISDPHKVITKFESGTRYLVAEQEETGDLLGVLDFQPLYPFESGKEVVTFGIAVDPDQHRSGIGSALIDAFFKEAKTEHYRKVVIHVLGNNEQAIAFYQKLQFTQEASLKKMFRINGQLVDDVIFTYTLEAEDA